MLGNRDKPARTAGTTNNSEMARQIGIKFCGTRKTRTCFLLISGDGDSSPAWLAFPNDSSSSSSRKAEQGKRE